VVSLSRSDEQLRANSPLWHALATSAISSENLPNGASGSGPSKVAAL
jgi:hypothetical protein